MSVAQSIGDSIRNIIAQYLTPALQPQGIIFDAADIVHDFARLDGTGLESTFYITTVDNVKRKPLAEAVAQLQLNHPELRVLKVKSKRPGQCVRLFIATQHNHAESNHETDQLLA